MLIVMINMYFYKITIDSKQNRITHKWICHASSYILYTKK